MLENYTLHFLNLAIAAGDALGPLTLLFLFLSRVFPIVALAPFLGARVLPHPVKVCLCISLFILFLPAVLESMSGPVTYNYIAIMLMAKELFIGFVLGTLVSMPFNIVQNAGILIDHQRGGASLMINDPTIQNQSSPLGTFFNLVMIYIFFVIDGPFMFFDIILETFRILPIDQFFAGTFFIRKSPFWADMIALLNKVMVLSIQMAMPSLLIILMTDFFLGIANRLAPQVQITFLGMPLKSLLALMIICLGWNIYIEHFSKDSLTWLVYMKKVVSYFALGKDIVPVPTGP